MGLFGSAEYKVLQWTISNQAGENMDLELRRESRAWHTDLEVISKHLMVQVMREIMSELIQRDHVEWNVRKAKERYSTTDQTAFCPLDVLSFLAVLSVGSHQASSVYLWEIELYTLWWETEILEVVI